MRTIALINQKGGVGKSTLAIHLAVAFTQTGHNTVILDLDPQASATEWADSREAEFPHVESLQPSRLDKRAEEMRGIGADILILDTAPHAEATALAAARMADLVLIPSQPSMMDLRAMVKTAKLLELVRTPAYAVLNGVQHHSHTAAHAAAKTITDALGVPVAPVWTHERVAYQRCLIEGLAAQETDPESKAAYEIRALQRWVDKVLNEKVVA